MTKNEIVTILNEKFDSLYDYLNNQADDQFEIHHTPEKWSTGQHVEHLRKSTKALNIGLNVNPLLQWFKFGKKKGPSMNYEEVKAKYKDASKGGKEAPDSVYPKEIPNARKAEVMSWLAEEKDKMIAFVNRKSEKQLNSYCLPHPFLGNHTWSEFILWCAVHTEHHLDLIKKYNAN